MLEQEKIRSVHNYAVRDAEPPSNPCCRIACGLEVAAPDEFGLDSLRQLLSPSGPGNQPLHGAKSATGYRKSIDSISKTSIQLATSPKASR
jgi:hypothetical protein